MNELNEPWRDLKAGDKVRMVRIPSGFAIPGAQVFEETISVYQSLVNANAVLTIDFIDQYENPWTESFEIGNDGEIITTKGEGHSLALNDDSWERVNEQDKPAV